MGENVLATLTLIIMLHIPADQLVNFSQSSFTNTAESVIVHDGRNVLVLQVTYQ